MLPISVDIPDDRIPTTNVEPGETIREKEQSASIQIVAVEEAILAKAVGTKNSPKHRRLPRPRWRLSRKQKNRSNELKIF